MSVHNRAVYAEIKRLLAIPQDEPIFILRGQDPCVLPAMKQYQVETMTAECDSIFQEGVEDCVSEFEEFTIAKPERMKVRPD